MTTHEKAIPGDPVLSRNVIEMLTVANEFCLFLEKADDYSRDDILVFLQRISPLLYIKASLLPLIEPTEDEAAEHFITEEQWEDLFNTLRQKFGDDDIYYFIDPQDKSNQDAIRASLSENFADVYQDLKDFVLLYQKPRKTSMDYAVYECRNLYETRFGYRLVRALSAIHHLLHKEGDKGEVQDLLENL
jgi:hypothetical protein